MEVQGEPQAPPVFRGQVSEVYQMQGGNRLLSKGRRKLRVNGDLGA
jgi:hypothetical protein